MNHYDTNHFEAGALAPGQLRCDWPVFLGGRSRSQGVRLFGGKDSDRAGEASYDELRRRLESAIRSRCPRWLQGSADDIVQEAMLKVMRIVRRADGRHFNSSYLHRIAYSAMVDEIRRVQRKAEVAIPDEDDGVPLPDVAPGPAAEAMSSEAGVAIHDCLGGIKEERRLAVTLYLQGHSVKESADILGWLPKRTENLVYRGLADLRQCLMAKGVTP